MADFLLTPMLILLTSAASLGNSSPSQALAPRFSRLQSDEASYRVFLLAVTLLLKADFTSLCCGLIAGTLSHASVVC